MIELNSIKRFVYMGNNAIEANIHFPIKLNHEQCLRVCDTYINALYDHNRNMDINYEFELLEHQSGCDLKFIFRFKNKINDNIMRLLISLIYRPPHMTRVK